MYRCLATFFLASVALAGYPDNSNTNTVGNSQSYGYGYSGSYSGGAPPNGPNFDFQGFLSNYLDNLNRAHQEFIKNGGGVVSYSYSSSGPNGNAKASSSITYGIQSTAGAYAGPGFSPDSSFSGGYGGSFAGPGGGSFGFAGPIGPTGPVGGNQGGSYGGGAPNVFSRIGDTGSSIATGSIGPNGVQQTAAVYPENPNAPNINTQYAGSDQPGGFRSVFTSSSSHTANVNGQSKTVQQASTTVNDNGKITTYTAKNP